MGEQPERIRSYAIKDRPATHPAGQRANQRAESHPVAGPSHPRCDGRRVQRAPGFLENFGGLPCSRTVQECSYASSARRARPIAAPRSCPSCHYYGSEQRLRFLQLGLQRGYLSLFGLDD